MSISILSHSFTIAGANESNVSRELIPNDLKEQLIRLEHENKLLRQNQGAQADQASVQVCISWNYTSSCADSSLAFFKEVRVRSYSLVRLDSYV